MYTSELKVLIVDSAQNIRISSKPILMKEMGFLADNILETNDGRTALNILQAEDIDLVLSEWDLPEISGIELLVSIFCCLNRLVRFRRCIHHLFMDFCHTTS